MPDIAKCRSCNADVYFVRSAATRNYMCIDAKPCDDGNVVILNDEAIVMRGDMFEQQLPTHPRYKDHHATCPQGAAWKKKAKK